MWRSVHKCYAPSIGREWRANTGKAPCFPRATADRGEKFRKRQQTISIVVINAILVWAR